MGKGKTLIQQVDDLPPHERTGDRIISLIRQGVSAAPVLIEEIFPGKRLVKSRLTPRERAKVATKASQAAASERYDRVRPIIEKVLEENPDASLADIKAVLDNSGVTPVRSAKWSRASINFIIVKAGIRAKDQP